MRRILLLGIFQLWLTAFVYGNEGYTIKGRITGDYGDYIYLSYKDFKDSVRVQNNTFEFSGNVDKPVRAWLNLRPPANVAWVYLENSVISVEGDFSNRIREKDTLNLYRVTLVSRSAVPSDGYQAASCRT